MQRFPGRRRHFPASWKSTIAGLRALHLALRHPGSLIMMTAKVAAQAGELLPKIAHFAAELGFRLRSDGVNPRSLLLPNGSRFVARPAVQESSRDYSERMQAAEID